MVNYKWWSGLLNRLAHSLIPKFELWRCEDSVRVVIVSVPKHIHCPHN